MNLNLPNQAQFFVKSMIEQGRFGSEEEAVLAGLQLLMDREQLRNQIQVGNEQTERGDWSEEDATLAEVFAEIDASSLAS